MHPLALAAADTAEKHEHFPLPPWGYALIALAIFFVLFLATWSFRSVGTKHT
jgi:hypothetical protein